MTQFPLEKILEVDPKTYIETRNRILGQFDFVGVRYEGGLAESITSSFASAVPPHAEIVLGYHVQLYKGTTPEGDSVTRANAYGTALVPKK